MVEEEEIIEFLVERHNLDEQQAKLMFNHAEQFAIDHYIYLIKKKKDESLS